MSDYIKREDAKGYIKHVYHESVKFYEVDEEEVIDSLVEALNALPSADVLEVRHGHWIDYDDDIVSCECSACHKKFNLYEDDVNGYPYCPNCGAKMDRGEQENERLH